jgi:dTMP kinase
MTRTAPQLRLRPHRGPGRLVTVDGLDGSGKSTLVEGIREQLAATGATVLTTPVPSTGMRATPAFRLLRDEGRTDVVDPLAFDVGYMADRLQHCRTTIEPALRRGQTVVTDRYAFSSIGTLLLRLPELKAVVLEAVFADGWFTDLCGHLIQPDVSFVLRVPPEAGVRRLRARPDEGDASVEPDAYGELQEILLDLAAANRMITVDAGGTPQDTLAACLPYLQPMGVRT